MYEERVGLNFAQAEGVEALPTQLSLREISPELSATIWSFIYDSISRDLVYDGIYNDGPYLKDPWRSILRLWWILRLHQNADEAPDAPGYLRLVKDHITSRNYIKVFDFIQFVIQRPECPYQFAEVIDKLMSNARSAYRVIENMVVPCFTDEQAEAIRLNMSLARSANAQGPYSHLRNGSLALSGGNWAEAVRESIHSVEAAAKSIEPSANTLGPALEKLKGSIGLNPALARAYGALYGYSSDEKGIRHALVFDGVPNVSERDAIFMFGACASFVGYLISSSASK